MTLPPMPKYVNAVPPAAISDNADIASEVVDTLEFGVARWIARLGATDIAMAVIPKIQECDTADGEFADITGAVLAAAPSATDDNKNYAIDIKLGGARKRYQKLIAKSGNGDTGTFFTAHCELHFPHRDAVTAAGAGLAEWIKV